MYSKDVMVQNQVGLHARPATFFIQKANEFRSSIWIEKEERRVNAKSLLGILSLGIIGGTQIKIIADGADEQGVNKYPHLGELAAEQNLGLNLAEEAGGDDRGEHKQEHRDSNEDGTEVSEHGLERSQCQLAGAQTLLRPHAGTQNGKSGAKRS